MDLALAVESRYFAKILRTKEAAAMIRSLFLSMGELNKGARRPAEAAATNLKKIGVIGAGFMGAGVAYVTASAGLDVVLVDRDQDAADKGKAHSEKLISSQVAKGRAKGGRPRRAAGADPRDLRLRGAEGLRPRRRGGVRGARRQERGDAAGSGRSRGRRDLRQQYLDVADHFARGNRARNQKISSASISSRRSTR